MENYEERIRESVKDSLFIRLFILKNIQDNNREKILKHLAEEEPDCRNGRHDELVKQVKLKIALEEMENIIIKYSF
ncbi:MAG: hypothetical protein ACLFQV_07630 [Vulcanimicrobiota bacterium]